MWNYLLITVVNYFVLNTILAGYLTVKEWIGYSDAAWKDLARGFLILVFIALPILIVAGIEYEF
jgi:hypothetical protein